jgi:hypothetical protein
MIDGESLSGFLIWGQVLILPTDGSASMKIMSGILCSSATLRADVSASSLCVFPVRDLTLPICDLYPM